MGSARRAAPPDYPRPVEDQPTVISQRAPLGVSSAPAPDLEARPSEIPPGARLGHFQLLEYVGGGGMGRVFRAVDTRLGRTVALKVLPRDQAGDTDTLMRFHNEARSAARLNHESIAQVYYSGEDDGLPFITFEFVEGVNIRDLVVQRGPLPLAEALSYTFQVAKALAHAASHNVVHRDIKPSNVLITSEGRVKLIDMGLARMQKVGASANDLTASGVTLGTFDYISPEQARDPRNADERSDIYSLGCTLFYMLTGRPPFPEGTVLQKLLQHQGIEAPDVRQFRPDLPEEVSRVLRRMMAKEPRRRYQDSSKLIESLVLLAEQTGLRPLGPGHATWAPSRERKVSILRRHVAWMAPVAALIVGVALLDFFSTPSARDGQPPEDWPAEPNRSVSGSPPSKEMASPGAETAENEAPPSESPKQSADDRGGVASNVPGGFPDVVGPAPDEPTPATDGRPELPERQGVEAPVDLAQPNPLSALLNDHSGRNGLGPQAFEGGVFLPSRVSTGLSLQPQAKPTGGEPGEGTGTGFEPARAPKEQVPRLAAGLVVDPNGRVPGAFATLGAACLAASRNDVIELRYNGRLEEEPLTLADLELVIRGAAGFQPVVGFQPAEIEAPEYPCSMFTLSRGRLTLVNVAVELDIPRQVATESWSLFEIEPGAEVDLESCWLTIRNVASQRTAYHQEVTFFRLRAAPPSSVATPDQPAGESSSAAIELADCGVRGEAVFLRTEDLQPVNLVWRNGLLITTEQLLMADGVERIPQPEEIIRIKLAHLTAVVDGGLCRFKHSEFAPYHPETSVECSNSILIGREKVALVEQVGVTDIEQSLHRFQWLGNRNLYEGFTDFWRVCYLDPEMSSVVKSFDDWQFWWGPENEQSPSSVRLEQGTPPGPERPVHSLTPDDYAWAAATPSEDPSPEGAADAQNAGFQADRLPQLPLEPAAEPTLLPAVPKT
jgi:serine/threonine protein kinase